MKRITIALFMFLMCPCVRASDTALIRVDLLHIKAIGVKGALSKYPKLKSTDLVFNGIHYTMSADGSEVICIDYKLPDTAKQKDESNEQYTIIRTETETVAVSLSSLGEIKNVAKGMSESVTSKSKN